MVEQDISTPVSDGRCFDPVTIPQLVQQQQLLNHSLLIDPR